MLPDDLPDLSPWGLREPTTVTRPADGINNAVWLLDEEYVVRRYSTLDAEHVAAEHRLLAALDERADLPFAVPAPIRTSDGATFVVAGGRPVAVFAYRAGAPAPPDPASMELAGEALGLLDAALAELPAELAPRVGPASMAGLHPAVDDLDELGAELERRLPGDDGVAWFRAAWAPADEAYASLRRTLPTQILHADLSPSNVLIHQSRVSAILDFDHACLGLRVEDPVAAMHMAAVFGTAGPEETLRAFRRGYVRTGEILPAEDAAVPVLLRRRGVGAVVWQSGLWRSGLGTFDDVRARLADGPAFEERLTAGAAVTARAPRSAARLRATGGVRRG
ncbi:aminoglycoside phosphotransferase [Beutenbergia cavernae DSM 12333]|uniref:Aminoglycoside phosphotransferase n=1 Tax=Beutenbergia cavernae (strain ATCC BAA-8 / DSM 12333 / CCUG 43141 / JCM 11478 / NBRC 16432 / NCIMB 13614 / HKI 0122) TaxID=471853 RepID=C5BWD3_BEUC1|nr:phosphotransferase [Beutenbergia cavernae]ACQ78591.1 aminoglycoside phosphotransferase [Beutenbergia cavernae DSM 12333]